MMKLKAKSFVYGWIFGLLFLHISMTLVSLGYLIVNSFRGTSDRLGTAIFVLSFFIVSYLLILFFRFGMHKILGNSEIKITTFKEDIIMLGGFNSHVLFVYFMIIMFGFILIGFYLANTIELILFS